MRMIVALTIVASAVALSGCDLPDKLEKPNPAATWTGAPTVTSVESITLDLSSNGSFKARTKGSLGEESEPIEGRWSVGESWAEKACWERVKRSDFDALAGRGENSRVSRATVSLRYWIAKGADLPDGAKVVSKRSAANSSLLTDRRNSNSVRVLLSADPPPPANATGEIWLVEEDAELVRTGRAASASGRLLLWPIAIVSECLGSPDKDAKVHLRFRSRNLAAAAS